MTTVVGVGMIRQRVFAQAQTQVNADLEAAKEIYQSTVDRLEDAIRIHATRMVIYGALSRQDTPAWPRRWTASARPSTSTC